MTAICRQSCRPHTQQQGFTLIELMVVVAIIAILARVALPAYTDYVRRSAATEAINTLADYRVKMEQYYQDNRAYGNAGGTTCANGYSTAPAWTSFTPPNARYFTFSCQLTSSTNNQGYTIVATGIAGKSAAGHEYSINQADVQKTTKFKGATSTKSCWLLKGNEC